MQSFTTKLVEKKQLSPSVFLYSFRAKNLLPSFLAGQYFILDVPIKTGGLVKRLYSASNPPGGSVLELLVHLVPDGAGSTYLSSLSLGDHAFFSGPAGVFFFKSNNCPVRFLSTGTGLAPFRSMLFSVLSLYKKPIHLSWGLAHLQDVFMVDELNHLVQTYPQFSFSICLSQEKTALPPHYILGRITNDPASFPAQTETDYYVCGKREVVESIKTILLPQVGPSHLFFEKY